MQKNINNRANIHQKRYTGYIVGEKLAEHLQWLMYEADLEAYQKSKRRGKKKHKKI